VRALCAVACAALLSLVPTRARAARCVITTTGLAFGSYDPFASAPVNGSGSIVVYCNGWITLAYVSISAGSSGDGTARAMASGAERLKYNVYRDAAQTQLWSDAPPGVPIGPGFAAVLPFYGSIPAGQDVAVGTYTDALTVTVNY
jgi:spore coat protein U domain-containing protein, fimbrial subunit CupE1/2/3/6